MTQHTRRAPRTTLALATRMGLAIVAILLAPRPAAAQAFTACYVPDLGALYLIGLEGLPDGCLAESHVQVSLSEGGGIAVHGSLDGLDSDDHPQYLLSNGVRAAPDGFAVTGTLLSGDIPTEGPGVRLMWYPARAALRAGQAGTTEWDAEEIGTRSVALGLSTRASGNASTALNQGSRATGAAAFASGNGTVASGTFSTAMGQFVTASGTVSAAIGDRAVASGTRSTALGHETVASGRSSTAMGTGTTASGDYSTAMGALASTNGRSGSIIFAAQTTLGAGADTVRATANNSFIVRAQRLWFGKAGDQVATPGRYIETSTGAYLSDGGTWTNASSVRLKIDFRNEDADAVLARLADLPVRSWRYRAEDPGVRHIGPTAQDFRAAFGLGDGDEAISTVDADGIAFLAIQALEARTRALLDLAERVERLERELALLRERSVAPPD
jgi:trimeric autotransporter adhesin